METNFQGHNGHKNGVNVGDMERVMTLFLGAAAGAYGFSRKTTGGAMMTALGGMLLHRGATGFCPLYEAAQIDTAHPKNGNALHIMEIMTVMKPRSEVYRIWRDFEKLPRFMSHIEEVKSLDSTHTEWRARLPMGMGTFRWKAEVVEEQPDERMVWQSLPGSDVENMGEVVFRDAPGNRGTEIMVNMAYQPPGGKIGEIAAAIANPAFSKVIREDIRRFKSFTEAGEIPTIEGQPTGIEPTGI